MGQTSTRTPRNMVTGHSVVRLLIVSYFVAAAVGVIPGTDMAVLVEPFLSPMLADIVTVVAVAFLATLVMVGRHRRGAALVLAIMLFWSSYLGVLGSNGSEDIGAFWRDLALIGALILTYADAEGANGNDAAAVFGSLPRQLAHGRSAANAKKVSMLRMVQSRQRSQDTTSKKQFREDFDLAKSS